MIAVRSPLYRVLVGVASEIGVEGVGIALGLVLALGVARALVGAGVGTFEGVEATGVGGAVILATMGLAAFEDGGGAPGAEPTYEASLRGPIAPPIQVPSLAGG